MKKHGTITLFFFLTLTFLFCSGFTFGEIEKQSASVVMIKNPELSTYGTGFVVGIPGKTPNMIVTSYSVVATQNGAIPRHAYVCTDSYTEAQFADVVLFDPARNIAVLRLPKPLKHLKPLLFHPSKTESRCTAVGYEGTGNIMSDFESFNITNLAQLSGNLDAFDTLNSILIYRYSNEFERAFVGAPILDNRGYVGGMCAYSLDSMNTYSQYILSAEEIMATLSSYKIDYMTAEEFFYAVIMLATALFGIVLLLVIILVTAFQLKKQRKQLGMMANR